jgi:hypothetical protein
MDGRRGARRLRRARGRACDPDLRSRRRPDIEASAWAISISSPSIGWHVDHFAGVDVQRFVVTEIVAAAGSLVLFDSLGGFRLLPR